MNLYCMYISYIVYVEIFQYYIIVFFNVKDYIFFKSFER